VIDKRDIFIEIVERNKKKFNTEDISSPEIRKAIMKEYDAAIKARVQKEYTIDEIFTEQGMEAQMEFEEMLSTDSHYQQKLRDEKNIRKNRIAEVGEEAYEKERMVAAENRLQELANETGVPREMIISRTQKKVFHPGQKKPTIVDIKSA